MIVIKNTHFNSKFYMKKGFYFLVLTGCIIQLIVFFSCSKTYKTYEELKADKKANHWENIG